MDSIRQLRKLEITVLSAEDLRVDCKPATKNLYVVVRPESIKSYTTAMAEEGNVNPSWNQKFMVDMPMHARCITFEVKCKTSMGVKDVGVARVAASEFLGGVVPDHCLQFLSFRLRDWEGRRNGVLNFSVRAISPGYVAAPVTEKVGSSCGFHMRDSVGALSSSSGGVVTGIPVSWKN
ncbi:hypothetical protein RIF29_30150 [Crotalaria pallida]|uniref:C2 domain-containing protein n=1 Tax=Crotalaria pallida TaxID=3830 RepID=A0AAN9EGA9_CROPI